MPIMTETEFPYSYTVTMHPNRRDGCGKAHASTETKSFATYIEASDFAFGYVQRHGGDASVSQICKFIEDVDEAD